MISLSEDTINELFVAACSAVLQQGLYVAPRGLPTREVLGAHLCLRNPRRRLLDIPPVRVLNPAFALAETIWILSGSDEPWIHDFNGALRQFTDDGVLRGAYGPRMRRWGAASQAPASGGSERDGSIDQLEAVRRVLATDPDSRQAVIQLFDPAKDFRGNRDVPCTLSYRFYIRRGALHMHTTMRSQDLWLGFGYDVFAATVLQELLADWLQVSLGEYHHHVDSLHLYESVCADATYLPATATPSEAVALPAMQWAEFDRVLATASGQQADTSITPDPSWDEARQVLDSYRLWRRGDRTGARALVSSGSGTMARALQRWYARLDEKAAPAAASTNQVKLQ